MRHSHAIESLRDGLGQRVAIAEQNEDLVGRDAGSYQASARLSDPVGFCPVALERQTAMCPSSGGAAVAYSERRVFAIR
jgi:hypothetical protein